MTDPLPELESQLPTLISTASHSEIWGISLSLPSPQRTLVLKKYLTAHKTPTATSAALLATLEWRKSFKPGSCITESHDQSKFGALGFMTTVDPGLCSDGLVKAGGGGRRAVVTWNIYGAVRDHKSTFGDQGAFLRWRVGLMERGIRALRLGEGEGPGEDIAIVQVHDYLNVSLLRLPPETRAATKETIAVLSAHYPELLSRKYFVNVPVVMGWMFTATKVFLSKETVAKFQVLSYGSYIAAELGKEVPKDYGGEGASLEEQDLEVPGKAVEVRAEEVAPTKTEPAQPAVG
ncbi:MAG: Non-classical phosphatidylinositol transfer protein (PITP) [Stictis urceolatum]|nr:Non-classical phosphatidylinositol transfer protein (PITP) [Stictis urceolata]